MKSCLPKRELEQFAVNAWRAPKRILDAHPPDDAGRFSFNVAKGRCETCEAEGFVCVELLFLPSVYAPCPTCHGARYNAKTLEIKYRGKSIADVLNLTVDAAFDFFADEPHLQRALGVVREVGLGY